MNRKKPGVDVINDVLLACREAFPNSAFVQSLYMQYHERGGLSKKQLEGLYGKASKVIGLPAAKLATLEAVILKKPTRYKSEKPAPVQEVQKDEATGQLITEILDKYPQHKRVLFFRLKYDNNEALNATEQSELKKFHSILKK